MKRIEPKLKRYKVVKTKRNKFLEPMFAGKKLIIGYNKEIHEDDAIEFSYKLPLGAMKRLIESYYKDIQMYDEENVYLATSSSSGLRGKPYCYRMLGSVRKQLDKHGLNGKKIDDEVFDNQFKDAYEKMKIFSKNHGIDVLETFKPCKDVKCCNYTNRFTFRIKLLKGLVIESFKLFRGILLTSSFPVTTRVRVTFDTKF